MVQFSQLQLVRIAGYGLNFSFNCHVVHQFVKKNYLYQFLDHVENCCFISYKIILFQNVVGFLAVVTDNQF